MAAGTLPAPGATGYNDEPIGPCVDACTHRDCAQTRDMAAEVCRFCSEAIGFDRRFYKDDDGSLVHAVCLEEAVAS